MSFRDRNSKRSGGSHRRHGGNRRGSGFKQAFENDEDNERASSSNRRPGRPPPGLRGKEIGLFYRDLQRANREKVNIFDILALMEIFEGFVRPA